jgi:hypothetical protein
MSFLVSSKMLFNFQLVFRPKNRLAVQKNVKKNPFDEKFRAEQFCRKLKYQKVKKTAQDKT